MIIPRPEVSCRTRLSNFRLYPNERYRLRIFIFQRRFFFFLQRINCHFLSCWLRFLVLTHWDYSFEGFWDSIGFSVPVPSQMSMKGLFYSWWVLKPWSLPNQHHCSHQPSKVVAASILIFIPLAFDSFCVYGTRGFPFFQLKMNFSGGMGVICFIQCS